MFPRSKQHVRRWWYVQHTDGDGKEMFAAACKLGLEGIVSKRLGSVYKSDPSKTWVKVENPKSPHKSHGQDVLKVG